MRPHEDRTPLYPDAGYKKLTNDLHVTYTAACGEDNERIGGDPVLLDRKTRVVIYYGVAA